jgi:nicotinamidase-related amidase
MSHERDKICSIIKSCLSSDLVLSTALESVDKDYYITVLEDAVGDRSDDKHDFIILYGFNVT